MNTKLTCTSLVITLLLAIPGCADNKQTPVMDSYAESYVKLVLAVGTHDAGYVDAYYGPPEWRTAADSAQPSLEQIIQEATALQQKLQALPAPADQMDKLRKEYLTTQLGALIAFAEQKNGKQFSFDEESWALYNAVAPTYDVEHFNAILVELDAVLPGSGELPQRLADFRADFTVSSDRIDTVFRAAMKESRRRTSKYIDLPPHEDFQIEYVKGYSWSAYNWYQGGGKSLIQLNTDVPLTIDRFLDLATHEAYPGHHVYNALLEQNLVHKKGWVEFSVYPLFSPQSLIAEGSADFCIYVAFPHAERIAFEKETLFPLAGINPERVAEYYKIFYLTEKLSYADNTAARGYIDGTMTGDEAVDFMIKYKLRSVASARKRLRFVDDLRSYVINYNYGQDLVHNYINAQGGTADHPERRWELFRELISSPRLPAGLKID